jgi:hypothetical protein
MTPALLSLLRAPAAENGEREGKKEPPAPTCSLVIIMIRVIS